MYGKKEMKLFPNREFQRGTIRAYNTYGVPLSGVKIISIYVKYSCGSNWEEVSCIARTDNEGPITITNYGTVVSKTG